MRSFRTATDSAQGCSLSTVYTGEWRITRSAGADTGPDAMLATVTASRTVVQDSPRSPIRCLIVLVNTTKEPFIADYTYRLARSHSNDGLTCESRSDS